MNILYPPNPWCEWCDVWRLTTTPASTSPTLFEQWCGFFYVPHRLQNSRFFFLKKKSVQKSVKRGVRVLRARSVGTSHARRACEAREKSVFLASLPSLTLRFQPRSRPFVWLFALTWIHKNTDCFAVYVPQEPDKCKCCETGPTVFLSLSEKTRKSNRLQMSLQRQHFLLGYFKNLSVCPAGVWTRDRPLSRPEISQLS